MDRLVLVFHPTFGATERQRKYCSRGNATIGLLSISQTVLQKNLKIMKPRTHVGLWNLKSRQLLQKFVTVSSDRRCLACVRMFCPGCSSSFRGKASLGLGRSWSQLSRTNALALCHCLPSGEIGNSLSEEGEWVGASSFVYYTIRIAASGLGSFSFVVSADDFASCAALYLPLACGKWKFNTSVLCPQCSVQRTEKVHVFLLPVWLWWRRKPSGVHWCLET